MTNGITAGILGGVVVEALLVGYVMRRRGFDGYVWTLLGLFLGPIAIPVAIAFALRSPRRAPALVRPGGRAAAGPMDVLVGYDGSDAAADAVARVHDVFGDRIGRVAIARVTPLDAPPEEQRTAAHELAQIVDAHPELHAAAVVLAGEPAHALQDYASHGGYGLIVVGSRGSGWSTLLGSVASALARESVVPVLLVDAKRAALPST